MRARSLVWTRVGSYLHRLSGKREDFPHFAFHFCGSSLRSVQNHFAGSPCHELPPPPPPWPPARSLLLVRLNFALSALSRSVRILPLPHFVPALRASSASHLSASQRGLALTCALALGDAKSRRKSDSAAAAGVVMRGYFRA
jgi:hypothetical protein